MYSPKGVASVPSENHSHHNRSDLYQTLIDESGYGQQHFEESTGHLQSAISMNPNYFMQQNLMHENYPVNQSHGFTAHRSLMTEHVPLYHQTPHEQYMQQLNQGFRAPVIQQPQIQPQLQLQRRKPQRTELRRVGEEEVLVVELERPLFAMGKPRIRWTEELHARFLHAVTDLGGPFNATPKTILERMKVRGVTLDHIKSHLQKVRTRDPSNISVQNMMHHGIQDNIMDSHSPQLSGQGSSTSRSTDPFNGKGLFGADIGEYGRLLRSSETPNDYQNLGIAQFKRFQL